MKQFEAYRSATCHRPQQTIVDLDHFLDRLTCNPISRCSSGIGCYDNSTLESEG